MHTTKSSADSISAEMINPEAAQWAQEYQEGKGQDEEGLSPQTTETR